MDIYDSAIFIDWFINDVEGLECKTGKKYALNGFQNILFDLDGTLTDSKEGITSSYLYALNELGLIEKDNRAIISYIGQPLHKYFEARHKIENDKLEKAVNLYREYYSKKGIYENKLYEGITVLLGKLKENIKTVFLVTGKPIVFVKAILLYFKIDGYFLGVYGSGSGIVNSSKQDLISQALTENQLNIENTVMVGDTMYDIIGAKQNGIKSIAVTYGYGSIYELEGSNPDFVVKSVEELTGLLLK